MPKKIVMLNAKMLSPPQISGVMATASNNNGFIVILHPLGSWGCTSENETGGYVSSGDPINQSQVGRQWNRKGKSSKKDRPYTEGEKCKHIHQNFECV